MSDRMLVPFDGSPPAEAALEYAFENFPDAAVTAIYVIEVPEWTVDRFDGLSIQLPVTERAREYGERVLDTASDIATKHGRDIETEVETGSPDRRIVEHAVQGEYDTIVIGSHDRELTSRISLGTVAEKVVRRAPIPVVVVR